MLSVTKSIIKSHFTIDIIIKFYIKIISNSKDPTLAIPEILELCDIPPENQVQILNCFNEILGEKPNLAPQILKTIKTLSFSDFAKVPLHILSLKIFHLSEELIPEIIPFLFITAPSDSFKEILELISPVFQDTTNPLIYSSVSKASRPYLSTLFQIISDKLRTPSNSMNREENIEVESLEQSENDFLSSPIDYLDLFIILMAISRPSLRNHIPNLIWEAISKHLLTFNNIRSFFVNKNQFLIPYSSSAILFFSLLVEKTPQCIYRAAQEELGNLAISLFSAFTSLDPSSGKVHLSSFSSAFISHLLDDLIGNQLQSSIAVHALYNNVNAAFSSSIYMELDEMLSESCLLPQHLLRIIARLLVRYSSFENKSLMMISLAKRLFHTSPYAIDAGVTTALALVEIDAPESEEVVDNLLDMNFPLLKPSSRISILEILQKFIAKRKKLIEISKFLIKRMNELNIIKKVTENIATIGTERSEFAIFVLNQPTSEHARICGLVMMLISTLFHIKNLPAQISTILAPYSLLYDLTLLSYIIPSTFFTNVPFFQSSVQEQLDDKVLQDITTPKDKEKKDSVKKSKKVTESIPKAKRRKRNDSTPSMLSIRKVLMLKATLCAMLSGCEEVDESFMQIVQVLEILDSFLEMDSHNNVLTDFPTVQPIFALNALSQRDLTLPDTIETISILLKSLNDNFVVKTNSSFDGRSYIRNEMNDSISDDILFILYNLLYSVHYTQQQSTTAPSERSKFISYSRKCIKAAANAIDFLCICEISAPERNLVTFFSEHSETEYALFDMLPLTEDIGILCRLLLCGIHGGISNNKIAEFAVKYRKEMRTDFVNSNPIFPITLPDVEDIVKPSQAGFNWRLGAYLTLISTNPEQYSNYFKKLADEISSHVQDVHLTYVLAHAYLSNFSQFSPTLMTSIAPNLMPLLILSSVPADMRLTSKIIKAIIMACEIDNEAKKGARIAAEILAESASSADIPRKPTPGFRTAFKELNALLELLKRIVKNDDEIGDSDGEIDDSNEEKKSNDVFKLEETSDDFQEEENFNDEADSDPSD